MMDIVEHARELLRKATPGPWRVIRMPYFKTFAIGWHGQWDAWPEGGGSQEIRQVCTTSHLPEDEHNAALIAAAPTLLAAMAGEITTLRATLRRAQAAEARMQAALHLIEGRIATSYDVATHKLTMDIRDVVDAALTQENTP